MLDAGEKICFVMVVAGDGPRGVFGSGRIVGPVSERVSFDPKEAAAGKRRHFVDIEFETLVNPREEAYLSTTALGKQFPEQDWRFGSSGEAIKHAPPEEVLQLWHAFYAEHFGAAADGLGDSYNRQLPEDVERYKDLRFIEGQTLPRAHLHARFGGQMQGGISTPRDADVILLFTGESGERYGYRDGWTEAGVYEYAGEGQRGDMAFERGNAAIRDSRANGKALLLFHTLGKGRPIRFMGVFDCAGWDARRGPDLDGNERKVIIFHLLKVADAYDDDADEPEPVADLPLDELRARALAASAGNGVSEGAATAAAGRYYARAEAVRRYVLARADGKCECCGIPAPFERWDGSPYLEPHHTTMLSEGGPDHPRHVAAVCPNCHRRVHYGRDGHDLNERLISHLAELEGGNG